MTAPERMTKSERLSKAEQAQQQREAAYERATNARRKDLKGTCAEVDTRTAAGNREFVVSNVRETNGKKASLAEYATLIKRKTDRTEARALAMLRFDELWHRTQAGGIASPKYEKGVDVSHRPAMVMDDRAESLREMQALTNFIGAPAYERLVLRLVVRHTLTWMEDQGLGRAETLGFLILADIDAVARYYGLAGRDAEDMLKKVFAHMPVAAPPRP